MEYLKIGYIKKPHGLKGELKVLPLTDYFERFKHLSTIFFLIDNNYTKFTITNTKITPSDVILKINEINDYDIANSYKNISIFIKRTDGVSLEDGEYYTQDLINCKVYYNDIFYGKVINVKNYGSSDIFVISNNSKEYFYPFLNDYIEKIDLEKKVININCIDGFF